MGIFSLLARRRRWPLTGIVLTALANGERFVAA